MPHTQIEADLFMTWEGWGIWHIYQNDDYDQGIVRDFHYGLNPYGSDDGEYSFRVDRLCRDVSDEALRDDVKYARYAVFDDVLRRRIALAIDRGEIRPEPAVALKVWPTPMATIDFDEPCPACQAEGQLAVTVDCMMFYRWGDLQMRDYNSNAEVVNKRSIRIWCEQCDTFFTPTDELVSKLRQEVEKS